MIKKVFFALAVCAALMTSAAAADLTRQEAEAGIRENVSAMVQSYAVSVRQSGAADQAFDDFFIHGFWGGGKTMAVNESSPIIASLFNACVMQEALVEGISRGITTMQQLQQDAVRTWAAKNRRAIQKAQAELAEETARQIAQLRADGEFGRADDILDQSQIYMRGMEDVGLRVEEGIMTPELVEPVLGYFLRPDETETAEEASNAADDPAPGRTDEQPEDAEAARKAWEAVHALGVGDVSEETVADLFYAGAIVEHDDGTLSWSPGWSAENYAAQIAAWQKEVY